ncbi:MAG: tyrosine-type recombinase/integrase [Candidatus Scalindua sp.]|jgi:integrase|nr:tyrosine-type recombinase/integrase [Candidatus Neomarinimicrobiota bacterium]MBT6229898.1 tyrosine-type recombinase/integrase [Candidatus Scalindua sp.]
MATKITRIKRMPILLSGGKYYTRIRWGNDKIGRDEVKFPLSTDTKSIAVHRRDVIQDTSLRSKIIKAYEQEGSSGVKKIKKQLDWYSKGGTVVETALTLKDAVKEYEQYLIAQRLSQFTIDIYLNALQDFSKVTKVKRVDRISPRHFTVFKNSMPKLRNDTVNRKLRSLQTFFNWMHDEGHIPTIIKIKKLPTLQRPVRYFSDSDFDLILTNVVKGFPHSEAKMDESYRNLFVSAYRLYRDTGLRLAEPFNNELVMDEQAYRLKIMGSTTKNSFQRFVHLTNDQAMTVIELNQWLEKQMETRKDRYGTIKVFSRVFAKAMNKSGLKGKFHDLRKTFASRLWFLTGQEFALCYALGHTDTSMTKQYTSLDKVELSRAFPNLASSKKGITEGKMPLRVPNKGDIELYSNFGFMDKKH